MAKTGHAPAGASGSQFFVISGRSGERLPPEYGILGHASDEESLADDQGDRRARRRRRPAERAGHDHRVTVEEVRVSGRRARGGGPARRRRRRAAAPAATPTTAAATTPRRRAQRPRPTALRPLDSRPAAGQKKPAFTKPGTVLKPGQKADDRDDHLVRRDHASSSTRSSADPIPNSIAFLVKKGFYDGLTFHRSCRTSCCRAATRRATAPAGPGTRSTARCRRGYHYKLGDVAMAKTAAEPQRRGGLAVLRDLRRRRASSSRPDYGMLGHAADPTSLATIKRIARFATQSSVPSKKIYIWTAKLDSG